MNPARQLAALAPGMWDKETVDKIAAYCDECIDVCYTCSTQIDLRRCPVVFNLTGTTQGVCEACYDEFIAKKTFARLVSQHNDDLFRKRLMAKGHSTHPYQRVKHKERTNHG